MWLLGFFLHEMAFGLLSVFVPLYITGTIVGGTLVDVGIMTSLATFSSIPFFFIWGFLCDKTKHYKLFILISFSSITALLYVFALTTNITLLIFLFAIIAVVHVAHVPPKSVLVAESFSRPDWEKAFASYELLTKIGWSIGLFLGFLSSSQGFSSTSILLLCSLLNLAAFLTSAIFVSDPILVFERGLARIERTMNFTQNGITFALKALEGQIIKDKFKSENPSAFCAGLILFSFATSLLITPLPIFFSRDMALASSFVFAMFMMDSGGSCIGYFFAISKTQQHDGKGSLKRIALVRSLLALLLIPGILYVSIFTVLSAAAIMVVMGFAYAFFIIYTLSTSMELLPQGKTGLFNVLVGFGQATGCLIGPLIAANYGFLYVFIVAGTIFIFSSLAFKIFSVSPVTT